MDSSAHTPAPVEATIPPELAGKRLDAVLAQLYPDYSREHLKQWLKAGRVQVAGRTPKKPSEKVLGGETVTLVPEPTQEVRAQPQAVPLDVVFEDDHVIVLNKPAGLVVHPGAGNPDQTVLNGLLHRWPELEQVPRAGIVHRLDKDTTGLMVVAKTLAAQNHLVAQLQEHAVERIYDAIVQGALISGGTVDKNIGRHPRDRKRMAVLDVGGKPAVSHYRVLERFRGFTHVKVKLETGRTHQIRVHMASIGHPLLGDPVYGGRLRLPPGMAPEFIEVLRGFRRQALHAGVLSFTHPATGEPMRFKAPMPDDMAALIDVLRDDLALTEAERQDDDGWEDDGIEVAWVGDDGQELTWE